MFFSKRLPKFKTESAEKANLHLPDLNDYHRDFLEDYAQRIREKLSEIGDFITTVNPQDTNFIKNALTIELWSLKNVTPTFNRVFQSTSIEITRQGSNHLRGNLFDALDFKLANIKKSIHRKKLELEKIEKSPAQEAQILQLAEQKIEVDAYRICAKIMRIQATTVLCEIGTRHFLCQFLNKLEASFSGNKDVNKHYKTLVKIYVLLDENATKFSLDNLGKNVDLEPYSGKDTLEARCLAEYITSLAEKTITTLCSVNLLNEEEQQELLKNLKNARVFFNAKNELNYNMPTAPTDTEKRRINYTRKLDYTAASLGTITITTGAVGVFHPTALVVSSITGVGAGIAGLSSTLWKTVNATENLIKYSAPPQRQEAAVIALTPIMMLLNTKGVSHAIPIAAELIKDGATSISALQSVKLLFQRDMRNKIEQAMQHNNANLLPTSDNNCSKRSRGS